MVQQIKERYQNPTVDEEVRLRMYFYNSNLFSNVYEIKEINIFFIPKGFSPQEIGARELVQTIPGSQVVNEGVGKYYVDIFTTDGVYVVGNYTDVWTVNFVNDNEGTSELANLFTVYPRLWYSTPIPVVYDFNYVFRPSQLRIGSKQYLIIQVTPNVPKGTDLQRYYENLAILGNKNQFNLEKKCLAIIGLILTSVVLKLEFMIFGSKLTWVKIITFHHDINFKFIPKTPCFLPSIRLPFSYRASPARRENARRQEIGFLV